MDEADVRRRHPNAAPFPSAPPYPEAPSPSARLYPDLDSAAGGDSNGAPLPGFRGFPPPPYAEAPPPPHHAPPPPHYPHHQPPPAFHRPPPRPQTICDAIRQKIVLALIGVLLFSGGVGVTFWNEGRTVKRSRSLEEGLSLVTPLKPSSRDGRIPVSFELTDSLVHISERMSVPKPLNDPLFNIVVNAAKMKRVVEMYQWVETQHSRDVQDDNGETRTEYSYEYSQEWRKALIPSANFNSFSHRNPDKFPMEEHLYQADQVYLGPFSLSPSLLSKIDWYSAYDLSTYGAHLLPMGSKRVENFIYFGSAPSRPAIGDWRVSFQVAGRGDPVNAETLSVVAKQSFGVGSDSGPSLTAFETSNGEVIDFVYQGRKTKEQIFSSEKKSNAFHSWLLRGAGWLLMFIGVLSISDLVTTIFTGIPFLRDLVAMTSLTFALVVSGIASFTVIAVGWCVYRPMFALICFAIALAPFVIARCRRF